MLFSIHPVTVYQQNCTLLICSKTRKATLVDPGGEIELLLAAVKDANAELESILVTHGHLDHIGGVAALAQQFSVPIIGPHPDDDFWIQALPEQCRSMGFPTSQPFTPNRWLADGDVVKVGEAELQAIHCPGHTPGHMVFYHAPTKLALVGDVLFNGSIGRTDFPRGNHQQLIDSIQQKLWPLGEETVFIPGHGPMSTFGEEMRSNPYVGKRG